MKNKQLIYLFILLFVTLTGFWAIPALVKTATYDQARYPFVNYSSLLKEFCFNEFDGRKDALHDASGRVYTREQFDSVMPLLNYRQLHANGVMPDSIDGIAIEPKVLRTKQVVFRYSPSDLHTPEKGLYILYESLPKRMNLESPGDVFRLKNKIEFIDCAANTVNEKKSRLFQEALEKQGYAFPAQWTSGNLNIRKAYDEGYFSLDAEGKLFHIKMVNGRPYVRNTQIGKDIDVRHFSILEVSDKRFYGFLFDSGGNTYIIEENGGKYHPLQLDIDPIDLDNDNLMIMGNMLYWTVSVEGPAGKEIFALRTESLERVGRHHIDKPENKWERYAGYLFPFYLTFKEKKSDYIFPSFHFTAWHAFILNALLAVAAILWWKPARNRKAFYFIFLLITGIVGAIAALLVPGHKHNNHYPKKTIIV